LAIMVEILFTSVKQAVSEGTDMPPVPKLVAARRLHRARWRVQRTQNAVSVEEISAEQAAESRKSPQPA
jgi:hypothetical protein